MPAVAPPHPPDAGACRVCGSRDVVGLEAREMMFGTHDRFRYLECHACGCVQIAAYPPDIGKYYPPDYYSFQQADAAPGRPGWQDRAKLAAMRASGALRRRFWQSDSTRAWLRTRPHLPLHLYLRHVPDISARILDVGCGNGALLKDLYYLYYRRLHGVDPFVAAEVHFQGRLLVRKAALSELAPAYDCISFHHVLEHMPDQLKVLSDIHRLLARGGLAMIRIPVAGGLAWRTYRENWMQLDAPRHFYLHSERSFTQLAEQAGFDVAIEYDSTGAQFWGSELYRRDIPLMQAGNASGLGPAIFPPEQLADYQRRAEALNAARDGDQIVAILRKRR